MGEDFGGLGSFGNDWVGSDWQGGVHWNLLDPVLVSDWLDSVNRIGTSSSGRVSRFCH